MTTNEYIRTSKGKNDECYTERYAVEPLLDFLPKFKDKIIWCPFDTEESEFVKVFQENNYNVVYSHIDYGQDFYTYEPAKWDVLISNPPFTNKSGIFRRALNFNKPFALLMSILWLNDAVPAKVFKNKQLQILTFDERMTFKRKEKVKINFMSAYFCWNFLPKDFMFSTFRNRNQLKLIEE